MIMPGIGQEEGIWEVESRENMFQAEGTACTEAQHREITWFFQ